MVNFTVVYAGDGSLAGLQGDDNSFVPAHPDNPNWVAFVQQNGAPPARGVQVQVAPAYPPAVAQAVNVLKTYMAGTQVPQDQINKALIVVLKHFAIQALN